MSKPINPSSKHHSMYNVEYADSDVWPGDTTTGGLKASTYHAPQGIWSPTFQLFLNPIESK